MNTISQFVLSSLHVDIIVSKSLIDVSSWLGNIQDTPLLFHLNEFQNRIHLGIQIPGI